MNPEKRTHPWALPLACALATLLLPVAHAQYKIVGPDGKITFSDKPLAPANATVKPMSSRGGNGPSLVNLPYDLVQIANRYPATLYSTPQGCAGCEQARQMLKGRGIPFAERSVNTQEDIAELTKQTGGTELPVLKLGAQTLKGYAASEWTTYLDTAGYPSESKLPANYVFSPATPLAEPKAAVAKKEESKPVQTPMEPNAGTAGIRF